MDLTRKGFIIFVLSIGLFLSTFVFFEKGHATFFGDVKTGLQNSTDDRYGYSLFVPEDYNHDKLWPLVIALHDEGSKGDVYIQKWIQEAKQKGFIVFCPTYPLLRDIPIESDRRLLRLIQNIQTQYEVDPKKVLVTGVGFGGHYAVYLGLKYPKQFSAVATIGDGTSGPFQKVFNISKKSSHVPILMLVKAGEETILQQSSVLKKMEEKGNKVEILKLEGVSDLDAPEINSNVIDWFNGVVAAEGNVGRPSRPDIKEKLFGLTD